MESTRWLVAACVVVGCGPVVQQPADTTFRDVGSAQLTAFCGIVE